MSTIAWNVAQMRKRRKKPPRAFCEVDGWSFDPRYTEGKCPICGWVAPGAPEAPWWMIVARRFEWEMASLVVLLAILALAGMAVVHAAGYRVPWFGAPVHAAPVNGPVVSQSRAHASPSPSARHSAATTSPSPGPSSSPTKTP